VVLGFCLGSAGTAAASGWTIQPTPFPANAHAHGATLAGVSCRSAADCIAVGSWIPPSPLDFTVNSFPLAEHWNGATWSLLPQIQVPGAIDGAALSAVSCTPSGCMAVGYLDANAGQYPLAEWWNGLRWSTLKTPRVPDGELNAVSCTSVTACVAVGDTAQDESIADQWDGRRWSAQKIHLPNFSLDGNKMTGVSCGSAGRCVAVGWQFACGNDSSHLGPVLGTWQGGPWLLTQKSCSGNGSDIYMNGVSCTSMTACTAVGTVVYRWNGRSWSRQNTDDEFQAVSCSTSSFCVAVGYGTFTGQWTPSGWSTQTNPNLTVGQQSDLTRVWCGRSGACVAVGFYVNRAYVNFPLAISTTVRRGGLG
jgi:hypothetical protein